MAIEAPCFRNPEGEVPMQFIILVAVAIILIVGTYMVPTKKPEDYDGIPKAVPFGIRMVIMVCTGLYVVFSIILIVPAGNVKVAVLFGTVQDQTYDQGPHIVNPLCDFKQMSVRRQIIEFQSGNKGENSDDVVALSSDNLPLDVDVSYPFKLNAAYASWLYRNIGDEETFWAQFVVPAARAATRAATSKFNYDQATTSNRDALALAMEENFRVRLIHDMINQGMSKDDAEKVFLILPVQLRKVLPPQKVQNSIAEKIASEQDLQRQKILTDIAQQEAERRAQEGSGVKKLFDNLPSGFKSEQIAEVMNALANKERADAMLKAVENNKVNVMVMDGGNVAVGTHNK